MQVVVGNSDSLKMDDIQKRLQKLDRYLNVVQARIMKKQRMMEDLIANMSPKERALLQEGLKFHHLETSGENV